MKKTFILLFALLLILGAYVLEGGALRALLVATAMIPVLLGPLLGVWFSFAGSEITGAFKDAFSDLADPEKLVVYKKDLVIIKSLQSGLIFWSFTMIILASICILSMLTDVSHLGRGIAAACTALLLSFGLRAWLLIPMQCSIEKKLAQIG
jgi:flagellar motor component MotA